MKETTGTFAQEFIEEAKKQFKNVPKQSYANEDTKLDLKYLQQFEQAHEKDILSYFGKWTQSKANNADKFQTALPFPHIVIDNFFSAEYADQLEKLFPTVDEKWFYYCNPIEVKHVFDRVNELPKPLKDFFYLMSAKPTVELMAHMSGIDKLEYDPFLHGAGKSFLNFID